MTALVFFAALSLNLVLNFALGVRELLPRKQEPVVRLCYPWFIIFVSTLLLWVLFARVLFFTGGIFDFLLLLPLSVLGSRGLEKLFFYFAFEEFKEMEEPPGLFTAGASYSELTAVSALLTLRFALSFGGAFLLALAFSAGGLLAFLIVREIQKRSSTETVPAGLRGTPLLLISMGILSLVFSAASMLLLKSVLWE